MANHPFSGVERWLEVWFRVWLCRLVQIMGKEYRAMLDLVRWRKAVGRKETVALNENVLLEKASRVDYPGLLADVLDGLLSVTDENWAERCEELVEVLRSVV